MLYTTEGDVDNFTLDGRCYAADWEAGGIYDKEDGMSIVMFSLTGVWESSSYGAVHSRLSGIDIVVTDPDLIIKIANAYRSKLEEHIKGKLMLAKLFVEESYQEFD